VAVSTVTISSRLVGDGVLRELRTATCAPGLPQPPPCRSLRVLQVIDGLITIQIIEGII
jgi:hypothetical protein